VPERKGEECGQEEWRHYDGEPTSHTLICSRQL
jgi:hypothetical protein